MHAENILAMLNATRCERCGGSAVPGVTMCLACALEGRVEALATEAAAFLDSPPRPGAVRPVTGPLL